MPSSQRPFFLSSFFAAFRQQSSTGTSSLSPQQHANKHTSAQAGEIVAAVTAAHSHSSHHALPSPVTEAVPASTSSSLASASGTTTASSASFAPAHAPAPTTPSPPPPPPPPSTARAIATSAAAVAAAAITGSQRLHHSHRQALPIQGAPAAVSSSPSSSSHHHNHHHSHHQHHHQHPATNTDDVPSYYGGGYYTGPSSRRRGSDSSSEGFRDVLGADKWYIGGRTAAGEERFFKLGVVRRVRSGDRLSLDRLSL